MSGVRRWAAPSAYAVAALAPPLALLVLLTHGDLSGQAAGGYAIAIASLVVFAFSSIRGRAVLQRAHRREAQLSAALLEKQTLAEQLRVLATRCDLTGLANRHGFLAEARRVRQAGRQAAVALLDVDDFKGVNDILGHEAGDLLLVEVASRLVSAVGPDDLVARLGGDEFAILVLGDPATTAATVLEALRAPLPLLGQDVRVEVSIGVAEGDGPVEDLLRRADVAMYAAKAAGGYRWLAHRPEMSTTLARRLDLRSRLVGALDRGEVGPWFQPVVDLRDGGLVGFEALARWSSSDEALESPAEWIGLAEQTGLVVPIDLTVLEQALEQLARWRGATPRATGLSLAVNASGRTLQEPGAAARVLAVLARTGVPADRLVLEVTEGILLEDEAVGRRLQHLREEGVRIALDDFGTGWSSLSYLSRFPVDALKLDRSFTQRLHRGPGGEAVPAAVVQLARALDLLVVAEGIETEEQAQRLQALGAEHGQGWLYGRALDTSAALELVLQPASVAAATPGLGRLTG